MSQQEEEEVVDEAIAMANEHASQSEGEWPEEGEEQKDVFHEDITPDQINNGYSEPWVDFIRAVLWLYLDQRSYMFQMLSRVWIKVVGVGCPADNHRVKLGCPPTILVVHRSITIYFNEACFKQLYFILKLQFNIAVHTPRIPQHMLLKTYIYIIDFLVIGTQVVQLTT